MFPVLFRRRQKFYQNFSWPRGKKLLVRIFPGRGVIRLFCLRVFPRSGQTPSSSPHACGGEGLASAASSTLRKKSVTAARAASRISAAQSAPLKPSHRSSYAYFARSTAVCSGVPRACVGPGQPALPPPLSRGGCLELVQCDTCDASVTHRSFGTGGGMSVGLGRGGSMVPADLFLQDGQPFGSVRQRHVEQLVQPT